MSTNLNQVAAERGYPSTLLGSTPADASYWREPGLPTLHVPTAFLDESNTPAAQASSSYFQTCTDQMAPRYPVGTWVAAELLAFHHFLCPGQVLLWYHVVEGRARCTLARLVEVRAESLLLAYDKDGQEVTTPWWPADPIRPLFRVTHYLTPAGGLLSAADVSYWREPGLPPIAYLPTEVADGPTAEFIFVTDRMAPRFPDGTVVGLEPVTSRQSLVVGRVYVHLVDDAGEFPVGRLAHVGHTSLQLTQDNHPAVLTWELGAEGQPEMQDLYEVTCYSLYLPHDEARLPQIPVNDARPVLLEILTDAMGPRYPLGSRHFLRPVSPSHWAQARGVHALALDNGTWVVRRLAASATPKVLVLESDRTGDIVLLSTHEVVSVWKVAVADYMPEETEAEHHWMVQRSAL